MRRMRIDKFSLRHRAVQLNCRLPKEMSVDGGVTLFRGRLGPPGRPEIGPGTQSQADAMPIPVRERNRARR
jgi:hypothetical protein